MSLEPEIFFKLFAAILFFCLGFAIATVRTDSQLDNIERHMCAFRFFEDGTAISEHRDNVRFACMERAKS